MDGLAWTQDFILTFSLFPCLKHFTVERIPGPIKASVLCKICILTSFRLLMYVLNSKQNFGSHSCEFMHPVLYIQCLKVTAINSIVQAAYLEAILKPSSLLCTVTNKSLSTICLTTHYTLQALFPSIENHYHCHSLGRKILPQTFATIS